MCFTAPRTAIPGIIMRHVPVRLMISLTPGSSGSAGHPVMKVDLHVLR